MTPILNSLQSDLNIDIKYFNLEMDESGWYQYNIEAIPVLTAYRQGKEVDQLVLMKRMYLKDGF